ncbi:MAG: DUF285 domain-containing protein [Cyclobacteriaceae bacterium]|nr:DUF285 domain-containing protein [Cyclobacteriaceae bacterium HetDA_MAG_MS6]
MRNLVTLYTIGHQNGRGEKFVSIPLPMVSWTKPFLLILGFLMLVSWKSLAQQPFVTTWQTTGSNESITIPTNPNLSGYVYQVDWGDGSVDNTTYSGDASHTYAEADFYTVEVTGTFPSIYFNGTGDKDKIMTIEQWGDIAWTRMHSAFEGCSNLTYNATDAPDLSGVIWLYRTFKDATSFNGDLSNWDVSGITGLTGTFWGATAFNQDIGSWDVGNVELMLSTFRGATSFNGDIGVWNTENVTTMAQMFDGAMAFNQDIGSWVVDSVTSMSKMFNHATSFNQDLSGWNVAQVTQMPSMFNEARAFDQNLGNWDVSAVINMSQMLDSTAMSIKNYDATLSGWAGLPSLQPNTSLGVAGLIYCNSLADRNTIESTYNWTIFGDEFCEEEPFITTWQTTINNETITIPTDPNVAGYAYAVSWGDGSSDATTYAGDATHSYASPGTYSVKIVGHFPAIYFNETGDKDKILTIEQWGENTWKSMESAFAGCSNLTYNAADIPDLTQVTDLSRMFRSAVVFDGAIGNWDVSNVTDISEMFTNATAFNQDIGAWDVSSVTVADNVFFLAKSFNQDIGTWDVSQVTNMTGMFSQATAFNQDIGNWDVGQVTSMSAMFGNAYHSIRILAIGI